MVDLEWVIETAMDEDGICFCSLRGGLISEKAREKTEVRILFQKDGMVDGSCI
jgi:adenosine deaminase CECR1